MTRLARLARTEVLEHLRQPWMLLVLVINYLLWSGVLGLVFLAVELVSQSPRDFARLQQQMAALGVEYGTFLKMLMSAWGSMTFTNLPLFVAIMSGTSVLHDRECGTLPFLMLAPVTRLQLLVGKLAGVMALPLALHVVCVGAATFLLGRLPTLAPFSRQLGGSPAWWVAYLLGAPASAAFVGALGTVISARSRDARTAMQFTSFFIGLLSLLIGYVLVEGVAAGPFVQLGYAAGALAAAALTTAVGARLIGTDVTA